MSPDWVPSKTWTGAWSLPVALARPQTPAERRALCALVEGGIGPARLARELESCSSATELVVSEEASPLPAGVRAVVPSDDEYPACLREIAGPPLLLYVRGGPLSPLAPAVAIVGARVCTKGARMFAARLGEAFAAAGFTVVSGLARGIDAAAHQGALHAGTTVAVLGTGIDVPYPKEHTELREEIALSGALVTEFPPGTPPDRWHFPARNRIVSGLAIATVVVEAGLRSGALITAGFALDQGREVLACTVGPCNPVGAGVREMLRDGARLVVDADDATHELVELARAQGFSLGVPERAVGHPAALDGDAARVFAAVIEDTTPDEIVERTSLPPGRVAALLCSLELDGLVADDGGGRWRRLNC